MDSIGTIIQVALNLMHDLLPVAGPTTPGIGTIITSLETILPIAADEAPGMIAAIRMVMADLQASGNLTADQLAALQALDSAADAGFDAAAKDAGI